MKKIDIDIDKTCSTSVLPQTGPTEFTFASC